MKTNLLFGAALIASLAVSAPSTNAKSAMDHNLKCLWMNTDVAPHVCPPGCGCKR